jgi:hypothetical protein
MPDSPETSMTWASPALARAQRRSSKSISSSRPTSGLNADPREASNRLATALGRKIRKAGTGAAMPLSSISPRPRYSNRSPVSRPVLAAITTASGSAKACSAQLRHPTDQRQPASRGAFGVVLVRLRIAEINQDAVAHVAGDKPAKTLDNLCDTAMIGADDPAQILGIEPRRQGHRPDQVAKNHRQLAPLGGDSGARR